MKSDNSGRISFFIVLTAAFAVRIYYSLTTPLLETDGSIALLTGRIFDESGIIPFEGPFASVLNGLLFKIFGESILIGKLGDTAAGIGVLVITYLFTLKAYGKRAALLSAFFVALSPLNILFSIMAKPYMMLSFFITLSAYLFFLGAQSGRYIPVIAAALCIPFAFGFRTFSVFCLAGMLLMTIILLSAGKIKLGEKNINFTHPLVFIFSAIVFLSPLVFWRARSLGLYFFRDFGMPEWLKSQDFVYMERWENVEHHYLDSAFLFFPAFILSAYMMFRERSKLAANLISFCYCFSFVMLLFINPGHHFARILVPAIPFFCILSASLIDYLVNNLKRRENYLLLSALAFSPVLYISGRMAGYFDTEVQSSAGVLKMLCFIAMSFVIVFIFSFVISNESKGKMLVPASVLIALILIVFSAEGIRQADRRINLLSAGIMPYIGAIEHLPSSSAAKGIIYENNPFGMLEGKDSKDLRDLPLEDSLSLLNGDYKSVFLRNDISYIVMPMFKYADGIYYTYRDMSIKGSGEEPKMHEELISANGLNRIYDNSVIVCLYDPSVKYNGNSSGFTDRVMHVEPIAGNRGGGFLEVFFDRNELLENPSYGTVVLKNRSASEKEMNYIVNELDTVVEAESFYLENTSSNNWQLAYSHWSQGMPFMVDYYFNNTAMAYLLTGSFSKGSLVREMPLKGGCYKAYARVYLPEVKNGEACLKFCFDGEEIALIDRSYIFKGMETIFLGNIDTEEDTKHKMEVIASGEVNGGESYIVFDRLIFVRDDDKADNCIKTSAQDDNALESINGEINLFPGESKKISLPESRRNGRRTEIIFYSPSDKTSYLLNFNN